MPFPIGAAIGLGGNLLKGLFGGGTDIDNEQARLDAAAKNRQILFDAENPSNAENAAFKRRILGGFATGAGRQTQRFGRGAPGTAGSFELERFNPQQFFQSIFQNGVNPDETNKFVRDLQGSTAAGIPEASPQFVSPELKKPGFLGQLFGGLSGAAGAAGSQGSSTTSLGAADPVSSVTPAA
jgi:hypothetical protein